MISVIYEVLKSLKLEKANEFNGIKNYILHKMTMNITFNKFPSMENLKQFINNNDKTDSLILKMEKDYKFVENKCIMEAFDKLGSNNNNNEELYLKNVNIPSNSLNIFEYIYSFNLMSIDLSFTKISNKGIKSLSMAYFPNITNLNISNIGLEDIGMKYLVDCNFTKIKILNISYNKISYIGIEYLNKCNYKNLERINLNNNSIGDKGLEILSKIEYVHLDYISLIGNKISKCGLKYLDKFKNLVYVLLSHNEIEGNFEIPQNLEKIKHLDISNNGINDIDIQNLKVKRKKIQYLNISNTNIKENTLLKLLDKDLFNLSNLNINSSMASEEILTKIKEMQKNLVLTIMDYSLMDKDVRRQIFKIQHTLNLTCNKL